VKILSVAKLFQSLRQLAWEKFSTGAVSVVLYIVIQKSLKECLKGFATDFIKAGLAHPRNRKEAEVDASKFEEEDRDEINFRGDQISARIPKAQSARFCQQFLV